MMKIIFWNCQGVATNRFFCYLKMFETSILVLMETRINGMKANKIIKRSENDHSYRVETHGFSGGIWIL